ncbi:MAG: hypothetical protein ACK4RK_08190 [Gemmataceae bacterium]
MSKSVVSDRVVMIHHPFPSDTDEAPNEEMLQNPLEALEDRVRRLEDAVASVQDTHALEERVVARVAARVARSVAVVTPDSQPLDAVVEAGRHLLPLALESARIQVQTIETPPQPAPAPRPARGIWSWLPLEMLREMQAILRMFVDPHYRLSWYARLIPLVLVVAILTSSFWVPFTSIPIFGTLWDKTINLVLAFFLFKILMHEARRYRETFPTLAARARR